MEHPQGFDPSKMGPEAINKIVAKISDAVAKISGGQGGQMGESIKKIISSVMSQSG
jgi:hypothetical protein